MRLIQGQTWVQLAPTRLGAMIKIRTGNRRKRITQIFIQLVDNCIITADLFTIQTYSKWFANWAKNVKNQKN